MCEWLKYKLVKWYMGQAPLYILPKKWWSLKEWELAKAETKLCKWDMEQWNV